MKPSPQPAHLGVLLVWLVSVHAQQTGDPRAPCYFPGQPGHVLAPDYFPCIIVNTPYASCCQAGWTCYSNALCIATTPSDDYPDLPIGNVTRTACTSPFWESSHCGSVCLDEENKSGELVYCGDDQFCCESDYKRGKCVCGSGGNATLIAPGVAQTIIFRSSTPTGTPTINVVGATPSSRSTTARASTTTGTAARTSSATGVPAPTSSTPPEEPEGQSGNKGRTIGLAVGIPVGLIAVGALGFLVWWKSRNKEGDDPIIASSGEMATNGAGPGGFGPMEHDHELRENDAFGPTWGNDYRGPRRTDL